MTGAYLPPGFPGEGYLCGLCKSQDSGVLSWLAVYSVMVVGGQIREITLWTGFSMHFEVTVCILSVFLQTVSVAFTPPAFCFLIRCDKPP
jgi:hypothetical protein